MNKIPHNPEEIIAIVDDDDNVIGETKRREIHAKGILHREAYVYLINSKKQVLLHKRVDMPIWDHSCSGHFPTKQSYLEAAQREFEEELGIKLDKKEFNEIAVEKLETIRPDMHNHRFAKIFLVRKDIPLDEFKVDEGEIVEVRYFNKSELNEMLNSQEKIFSGSAKKMIKKYILKLL